MASTTYNLYFGREEDRLADLEYALCPPGSRSMGCWAVRGPHESGKSTLLENWAEKINGEQDPSRYALYYTFGDEGETTTAANPREAFWVALMSRLSALVGEDALKRAPKYREATAAKVLDIYRYFENFSSRPQKDPSNRMLKDYFTKISELGIRLIVIIDDFDDARIDEKQGKDSPTNRARERLFIDLGSLSNTGIGKRGNHSFILGCRRTLGTIAQMAPGSTFVAGFDLLLLRGFNSQGLAEYWDSFRQLRCGEPTPEVKETILYFCGRCPGLLYSVRSAMARLTPEQAKNPQELYRLCKPMTDSIFDKTCKIMQQETGPSELNYLDTFTQWFVGPAFDRRVMDTINSLRDNNFLTERADRDEPHIFTLAGLDQQPDIKRLLEVESKDYEPLAPALIQYVKTNVLPTQAENLASVICALEYDLRKLIRDQLKKAKGFNDEQLEAELRKCLPEKTTERKSSQVDTMWADAPDALERGLPTPSILYTMTFYEYYRVMSRHWAVFSPYFSSFAQNYPFGGRYLSVKEIFEGELTHLRNRNAHQTLEYLTEGKQKALLTLCNKLLRNIQNPGATVRASQAPQAPAQEK